jgi:hypothetical protein
LAVRLTVFFFVLSLICLCSFSIVNLLGSYA